MSKSVLLCDDELHILRAAEFKLKRAGMDVRCGSDGEEAWQLILEKQPDILVTDCQMPRLDGLELTRRIRATPETSNLPVVMLTAKGYEISRGGLQEELRIAAILAKPFSPRELSRCIQEVLEMGAYTDS